MLPLRAGAATTGIGRAPGSPLATRLWPDRCCTHGRPVPCGRRGRGEHDAASSHGQRRARGPVGSAPVVRRRFCSRPAAGDGRLLGLSRVVRRVVHDLWAPGPKMGRIVGLSGVLPGSLDWSCNQVFAGGEGCCGVAVTGQERAWRRALRNKPMFTVKSALPRSVATAARDGRRAARLGIPMLATALVDPCPHTG